VEGDLKVTQEMVLDLERTKKELESIIQRKEKDISGLFVKLEDEQSLVAKVQKHIKENQARYNKSTFFIVGLPSPDRFTQKLPLKMLFETLC
jgi:chromosome condensin MukBEF ATPase and DNA-binding subunit MukB